MRYFSKETRVYCALFLLFLLATIPLNGCTAEGVSSLPTPSAFSQTANRSSAAETKPFDYQVDAECFALSTTIEGNRLSIADAMQTRTVTHFKEENGRTSWQYPEEQISVVLEPKGDFLSVSITADTTQDATFAWPQISADKYYLPLGEGKQVPADDATWMGYLNGSSLSVLEQLSMPFWASSMGEYAVLYILEDPHRVALSFAESAPISFTATADYPEISPNKTKRMRIYITENNPLAVAKQYRAYLVEQGAFVPLSEKAKATPAIEKLYGAPFIYLWGSFVLSPEDLQWNAFRAALDHPMMQHFLSFAASQENGSEFKSTLDLLRTQGYVADFQKNVICRYLSDILTEPLFWDERIFPVRSAAMDELLEKGIANLSDSEKIQLYKEAMAANLPAVFPNPSSWMNGNTVDVIRDMKQVGIENAWIGLHGWEQAYAKPALVDAAVAAGYLIASYDSYHSIHAPGKEQWETARFEDISLYEQATVTNQNGKKLGGFQNVGRKLNAVLALPSVKSRMKTILEENQLAFNSWFVDCDATGEIYDDYTAAHPTTEEQDIAARLERMAYIRDTYKLVVGSEGGNDFAASTIAFAHGIELKSFSWMDPDMNKNKESPYYIGKYYNPAGGVAEHFSKRIPLKETYETLFIDPRYDLPLFKLVYNDSVISSYHWEWSTFKIQNATQARMLREILYNVPPLYHLDATEWNAYQTDIARHTAVWSTFSKQATQQEMTSFSTLSADGLVQRTQYGADIWVVANFGDQPYTHQQQVIPPESALIALDGAVTLYTPTVAENHR